MWKNFSETIKKKQKNPKNKNKQTNLQLIQKLTILDNA